MSETTERSLILLLSHDLQMSRGDTSRPGLESIHPPIISRPISSSLSYIGIVGEFFIIINIITMVGFLVGNDSVVSWEIV